MPLCIGDSAPNFTLPNQNGVETSLASFKGSRVVIYFYPKDDTPGCTKEACSFRDRWDLFKLNNIHVLGISKDASKSHVKFIDKYNLPFILLTDREPCPVATLYQSYGIKKFMGREYYGMMRHTFVIDKEGKIEFIYLKVKSDNMANQVLIDLKLN
tara:strand:- start:110 stop:577 length:468 start_codon:yes stop_codon:yes gene_type:complete